MPDVPSTEMTGEEEVFVQGQWSTMATGEEEPARTTAYAGEEDGGPIVYARPVRNPFGAY